MAIANVALTNTFDQWRVVTNQLVSVVNDIEFTSNLVRTVSNSAPLSITSSVGRGGTLYFDVTSNSYFTNTSTNVLATANAVNKLYVEVTSNVAIRSNNYTNTVGSASNTYSNDVGAAGNVYVDTVVLANLVIANAYAVSVGDAANANISVGTIAANAYARVFANTKLANTDAVIAGNLTSTQGLADSKGDVRNVTINNKTASYIITLEDNGKVISLNIGNVFVTDSIFYPGNTVSIFNNSSANLTITQNTNVTLYSAGTSNTGNRILLQRGIATLVCVAANTFVVTGAGMIP